MTDPFRPWTEWVWDGTRWTAQSRFTPMPEEWEEVCHGGECHQVPKRAKVDLPPETGATTGQYKTHAEVIASQHATIGGRDVYVETAAERAARLAGMSRDDMGYYRLVGTQRVYETGIDPESGRRFHFINEGGQRKAVWDDPDRWPVPTGTQSDWERQRREAQDRLQRLRRKYRDARGETWTVRRNLLTRIRDLEDTVQGLNRALGGEPVPPSLFTLTAPEQPRFDGGVRVELDYAIWDPLGIDEPGLSFANPLRDVPLGARIVVRATVTFGDRKWKPGMLASPQMCRVRWDVPTVNIGGQQVKFEAMDTAPAAGTDEYVCSNPLTLMRDFRVPSTGNTYLGKGFNAAFGVRVELYEIALGEAPSQYHVEGVDGTISAIWPPQASNPPPPPSDSPSDPPPPSGDGQVPDAAQLARFMKALRWVESSNNYLVINSIGCVGAYQFCGSNWDNWSQAYASLKGIPWSQVRDWRIPSNQDAVAAWKLGNYYRKTLDWRRVAWMWRSGYSKWDDPLSTMTTGARCYVNCVMRLFDGRARDADCGHCPSLSVMG